MLDRKYGAWSEEDMQEPLQWGYRFNKCSLQYGLPKLTLKHHLDCKNVKPNDGTKGLGWTTSLSPEIKTQFANHILKFEELLFGLTINDVGLHKLVYQITEQNQIYHNFNQEMQMAS